MIAFARFLHHAAARAWNVNGYAHGYGQMSRLMFSIHTWALEREGQS